MTQSLADPTSGTDYDEQERKGRFSEEQIRRVLVGLCGTDALPHYLAYFILVENEAAINSGQVPETTSEYLSEFQTAIMEWLDSEPTEALYRRIYELEQKLPERNFAKDHGYEEWREAQD